MNLITPFTAYITRENLFTPTQKVLLAVSGGADSVAMALLFKQAGFSFGIAHCNFQLRGQESERDEAFVTALAGQLGAPFFSVRFDTAAYAERQQVSIQVAARELRYAWLETTRVNNGYAYTATAHHMQDNVETVLMNFCKGTGMAGLHGILPRHPPLVRPLLFAQKAELLAYVQQQGAGFVEDSSNISVKYTRNFFRHRVLPPMQEAFPQAVPNMAASIERFREAELLYREAVERHRKRLVQQKGDTFMIPVLKLQKTVPLQTVAWEVFRSFGCSPAQLPQVLELLHSESGRWLETATHRVIRDRQWLLVTPLQEKEAPLIVIEKERTHVHAGGGHLKIRALKREGLTIPTAAETACIDRSMLQYPLLLRRWKQGDYFYPLGMRKKKKLSRFFIDRKLSLLQKENIWVLESGKRIVWVVGQRIDDRFKVTDSTREVLLLEWFPQ